MTGGQPELQPAAELTLAALQLPSRHVLQIVGYLLNLSLPEASRFPPGKGGEQVSPRQKGLGPKGDVDLAP